MRRLEKAPSPAIVVAALALTLAVTGAAIAGPGGVSGKLTKSKVRSIASKQIRKAASGLSVAHAVTADTATSAANATNAETAHDAQNLGGSPPGAFAPSAVEAYREVGAPGQPPFGAGWSNNAPGDETTAAFYEDPYGVVHLKGIVDRSGGTPTIFTLPASYRPPETGCFPTVRSSPPPVTATFICIQADSGTVESLNSLGDGTFLLDGLTFRAGAG